MAETTRDRPQAGIPMIVRHNAGSESTKPYKTESESMAMVGIC